MYVNRAALVLDIMCFPQLVQIHYFIRLLCVYHKMEKVLFQCTLKLMQALGVLLALIATS